MNYSATGEQLTSIANAIRTKLGVDMQFAFPDEFVSRISSIPKVVVGTVQGVLYSDLSANTISIVTVKLPPKAASKIIYGFSFNQNGKDTISKFIKPEYIGALIGGDQCLAIAYSTTALPSLSTKVWIWYKE